MNKIALLLPTLVSAAAVVGGCINVKTHSSFEPIYMTLDVNLKVQLQKELASVFDEIDAASKSINDAE